MESRQNITEELKQISEVVAKIGFQTPYKVPDAYFDLLPGYVLNRVNNKESEVLPKKAPHPLSDVPSGYFENLSANILQRIKINESAGSEALEDSAFPAELKDKRTYMVPEGYFEGLSGEILKKVQKPVEVKLVRMNRAATIRRYAMAAVIVGLILFGGLYYFASDNSASQTPVTAINSIPVEELENYLNSYPVIYSDNVTSSTSSDITSDDFKEILSDVPEDALQKYLINYTDVNPETVN